ncbi:uncharacterized protein CcaverHIS019_0700420 [Cutaneotrichosporon cavernicola]|uniref:Got1-domain-containing protein n=1 Tax=Cutaneotrichosporon cavernicola TaxID=279322 RepID=A0AA48QYN4_9TREE|nr:uncharacterized protein CcaverHIS019_0700420 [Cutaneotrichosporon cavernicola]BEI94470.1 hypothetical protein CcaverHIS019_0700420 [Cutaneotrichosporon cavernicola]
MWLSDRQKIGVALAAFGVFFMLLGIVLFFDGPLLALGNILFLTGLPLIIGPTRTFYFFSRKEKWRGTICFFLGISFFPVVLQALRQMPVIGTFLSLPYVRGAADRLAGVRQSAV